MQTTKESTRTSSPVLERVKDVHPLKARLKLTRASEFEMRPVRWLWKDRIAMGTLALLAGREGIGKSTLAFKLVADITNGTLEGEYFGKPRAVMIVATEDSWEFTIAPRLMAAGADLSKVGKVTVEVYGHETFIEFPDDVKAIGEVVKERDVALILLDPLMSRMGSGLDTHKDQHVRQALEPLVAMASDSGAAVLGLIHVNKGDSTDALNTIMGSRGFTAVARSVLYVIEDPERPSVKWMGVPKNNLGPSNLPEPGYSIRSKVVGEFEGKEVVGSYLEWTGEFRRDAVREILSYKPERILVGHDRKERILDYLADHPDISKQKIWEGVGGNRNECLADINDLIETGEIVQVGTFKFRVAE